MKRYTHTELQHALASLDIEKGDILFIHNSLLSLGMPKGINIHDLPASIYHILRELIGEEGTMVVPTFNFDFCKNIPFDKQNTLSKGMGVFSDYVLKLPNSLRSTHPMQSVVAVGRQASEIIAGDTSSAFEDGGAFECLLNMNCKILLLGASFNTVSFIHIVEERLAVPYRYWKTFSGKYIDHDIEAERNYRMYVRDLESDPRLKLFPIEDELLTQNKITSVPLGSGFMKIFEIDDFYRITYQRMQKNPYYLVSNHPNYARYEVTN